jgi:hypothetical protein
MSVVSVGPNPWPRLMFQKLAQLLGCATGRLPVDHIALWREPGQIENVDACGDVGVRKLWLRHAVAVLWDNIHLIHHPIGVSSMGSAEWRLVLG